MGPVRVLMGGPKSPKSHNKCNKRNKYNKLINGAKSDEEGIGGPPLMLHMPIIGSSRNPMAPPW